MNEQSQNRLVVMKVQSVFFPYRNKYHALLYVSSTIKRKNQYTDFQIYMCETDYKLFIISCMKVIHSNFAISTFAYIILSVFSFFLSFFLSFFHGKGLQMKKFLDFIRLEAVSPSRVKKKWKKINFSMPRGALGATSFYLRDGLRRKGGTTHSKKFLAII